MIIYTFTWLLYLAQLGIVGEYYMEKRDRSTGGALHHISTLKLSKDRSYLYTDVALDRSGIIISSDTISGDWFTTNDTLITNGYNVKWIIKKNSLIKLATVKIRYKKNN